MAYLLAPASGADVSFSLPTASVGEIIDPRIRRASRLVEREWSEAKPAVKPLLMFALQFSVGATAAAGTVLALFAWGGTGL
jgi:hypothetical protein